MLAILTRKSILLVLLFFSGVACYAQNRFWVSAAASNWNNTANWSTVSGGVGGASVPTVGNAAIFNGAAGRNGNCTLDIAPTVTGITMNGYTGTVDLSGFTLTTSGPNTLTSGTISNTGAAATLSLNASTTTTFNGTLVGVNVTGTSANILFSGSVFSGSVTVTKTGAGNDTGTGNNTFNGAVSLTNNTTAQLLLGNTNRDIFNSTLTITNANTGATAIAAGGAVTHQLNGNVSINYNSTGAVTFGNANGPSALAAGMTLTVASFGGGGCGNLTLNHFTASATAQTITLAGNNTATLTIGTVSLFNGNLTATAPSIILNASTFSGTTSLTKTGTGTDNIHGGNLFSGPLTVTNQGDGEMYFGHFPAEAGDTFNGVSTWNDLGAGRLRVPEFSAGTIFNAAATFNSSGAIDAANRIQICRFAGAAVTFNASVTFNNNGNSSDVYIAYDAGASATFNGPVTINSATNTAAGDFFVGFDGDVLLNNNVIVNSTCADNIQFAAGVGSVTLNPGFTITIGGTGFAVGQLSLVNFVQSGGTAQNLTLTGTALLRLGGVASFGGNVNFTAPRVLLNGVTFAGATNITKSGATNDTSTGGNTFNGTTTITDSGTGQIIMANTNPDIFNGNLTVTNSGTNSIFMATNVAGNEFNGNIVVNATSGTGIFFCNNATGFATQSAGSTISIGGSGFSSGELRFRRFTQNGAAANSLTLTGTCALRVGPATSFGGNLTLISPQLHLDGVAVGGNAYFEKTGATANNGNGGNVITGTTTLVNSGSGNLILSIVTADTFNGTLTATNSGTGILMLADNAPGNAFNGNIIVNSTAGGGVYFGNNANASSTQAAGMNISVGGSGFSSGELRIRRFTQLGAAANTATLTGTCILRIGPNTTFGGNVTFSSPQVILDGGTFNGTASISKTGATDNISAGGNVFNGTTTLADSGSGYLLMANTTADTFNGDLTITNSGSNIIYMAYGSAGNAFNGNVIVNSISGGGIFFSNIGTGTSIMAATKSISVGGSGFAVGELRLRRFTQNGNAPVNLTLTGVAILRVGPSSTIGGDATFVAPQVYLDGAIYNGTANITKNGPTDNAGNGGNTFNGLTSLTDTGSGYLMTGNAQADIFNDDLTITNSGSNVVYLAFNTANNMFNGNIILNATSGQGIYFGTAVTASAILADTKTVSIGGSGFLIGDLRLTRFTQLGSGTPQLLTLGGVGSLHVGPGSTFNSQVTFRSPQMFLDGCTYEGITLLEKTGATTNAGSGNNVFNGTTSIINSGSGGYRTNGNNFFNGPTTITNTGSLDILLELVTGSTYNGDVTFTNSGASLIRSSFLGTNSFNGNVVVNNTSGGGVLFCENGAPATATLADTKTITVGGSGFTTGELRLQRFTQVGGTSQTLALTGAAILRIGVASTFNGNVDFRAPQLYLDGCAYNGTAILEKNGAVANTGIGNNTFASTTSITASGSGNLRTNGSNTFNGTTTIVNSGSGDLLLELLTASTYNGDVTFSNTGVSYIRAAYIGANPFNGNITVNSTAGFGVAFCENVAGTATLANTKSIVTGGLGFTTGTLVLQRFTQVGPAPQTLTLTGTSTLQVGGSSTFNGNVDFRAPSILLNGCTYNGTTLLQKTGATNNDSAGSNVFNGVTTLTNSGSGWIRTARTATDAFNNDLTLTNTGISGIYMSDLVIGSVYNGNITVNCTLGLGIFFGNNNGSSTLAATKTISIGGSGFTIGELRLQRFTQLGATAQTLALTANSLLRVGPNSAFNGNVDFRAPQLVLDGANYNGTAYLEKNGAGNNTGLGNNTFASTTTIVNSNSGQLRTNGNSFYNGTTTLLNSGTNDMLLELTAGSTYNGDVTMTNTGSSYIRAAYIGANLFNGNIIVNSLNATGVFFCENVAGTATLANTKTISVGVTGFSAGELRIQRFTQTGGTAQSLALTGSAIFRTGPTTTWNGNFTVSSPIVFLDGTIFNGATNSITKTGTSTDASVGGNTFNGDVTITNSGTGIFRLAGTTGDTFNGDASFVQPFGTLSPAYAGTSTSSGDINVTSILPISFGSNGGILTMTGTAPQAITKGGISNPIIGRLVMNKASGAVTLNTQVNILVTTTFTSGVINSTAANFINFVAGASATAASNASHVDGPVRKTGNTAFVFPTGNAGIYRSIAISAGGPVTNAFTAQYFKAAQAFGNESTYAATLVTVSACEYWTLDRTTGTTNVNVTLSWNSPDCTGPYIGNLAFLRVARFNGTNWVDHGNGGTTGNTTTGTIVTAAPVTAFSPFTLASTSLVNPLPIELVSFNAVPVEENRVLLNWVTASELNNDYFTVERSIDGFEFSSRATIPGAGTKQGESRYEYFDDNLPAEKIYYRLKQTDFDKKSSYSGIVQVTMGEITQLIVHPNPVKIGGTISLNYTGNYTISNSLGVEVVHVEGVRMINISTLPAGLYIIRTDKGLLQRLIVE